MRRFWICAIGLGSATYLQIFGQLYLSEIIAIFAIVAGMLRGAPSPIRDRLRMPVGLLVLWLAATVLSDRVTSTPVTYTFRAAAAIVFTAVLIVSVAHLIRSLADARLLLATSAVGQVLGYLLTPTEPMLRDGWKYGLVFAGIFGLAALMLGRPPKVNSILLVAFAAVNIVLGSRSVALIALVAAVILLLQQRNQVRRAAIVTRIVGSLAALLVGDALYTLLATSGELGGNAASIYQQQGTSTFILLGGRPEIVFAYNAFVSHPFFGIGSATPALPDIMTKSLDYLATVGILPNDISIIPGVLPLHSALPGAIATSGVLAPWFWVWFVVICVRCVLTTTRENPLSAAVILLAVLGVWNTLFSPFANTGRYVTALTIVFILLGRLRDNTRYRDAVDEPAALPAAVR